MKDEEFAKKWNSMSEEEKRELAKSLKTPFRCGGLDYIDGKSYYRIGGELVSIEEFNARRL